MLLWQLPKQLLGAVKDTNAAGECTAPRSYHYLYMIPLFHLDVFDKRLDDDDEADLAKSKWTNINNPCVDFNGQNNSFVIKKSGLYFISLSLNVIANKPSKLVTKSLVCIHYHNGFRDVCKRVMLFVLCVLSNILQQSQHYVF
jgi:hypothetical protein